MKMVKRTRAIPEGARKLGIKDAIVEHGSRWVIDRIIIQHGTKDDPDKTLYACFIRDTDDFVFAPTFPAAEIADTISSMGGVDALNDTLKSDPWVVSVRSEKRTSKSGRTYDAYVFDDTDADDLPF